MHNCVLCSSDIVMAVSKVTRSAKAIWLVGGTEETFKGSKLPSRGEVLRVLFHHHDREQLSLKDSIAHTTEQLLLVWDKAKIPTKAPTHVVEHVRKLHTEWQVLKKLIKRTSASNLSNQQTFVESLDDLFDMAHRDAMTIIKIQEDRNFLAAQREKGRKGTMGGVDLLSYRREQRIISRRESEARRAERVRSEQSAATAVVMLGNDSSSDSDSNAVAASDSEPEQAQPLPKIPCRRGTRNVVTPEVSAALDRTATSDRNAAHILSAIASTSQLGQNVDQLIISRSAIRRARIKHRKVFSDEVKATFHPTVPLILHWDGKMMDDLTGPGRERVDRLPILVSGQDVTKLLSVPKLHDGTAVTMTRAVVDTVDEWGLRDKIKGLCFDTTASNTGGRGGVCKKLETEFQRELLYLACRHHVSEIVLEKVFSLHDHSISPNIELFSHFRDYWPRINPSVFSTATDDENTAVIVAPWKDDVIRFATAQLTVFQPRDDYRELLELTIIFLGAIPSRGLHFRYPGALHRARWMARAIYSLKMWLFRDQYVLQQRSGTSRGPNNRDRLWEHLKNVSLFVTCIYVRYWFQTPSAITAPKNDLALLCSLSQYPHKTIADAAMTAFGRHLWYLSELLVGLSFFDNDVSVEEKKLMVAALRDNEGSEEPPKRIPLFSHPSTKGLHDFVTKSTIRLFRILELPDAFLEVDPGEWKTNEDYTRSQAICRSMRVVNDLAERGVALIQHFNASITRDEEQKQYLLQVVEDHRNSFVSPTKESAVKRSRPL